MPAGDLVLGIDSSTSSTKAILFNCRGEVVARGRSPHPVRVPRPGWSEQPVIWWEALIAAIHEVMVALEGPEDRIVALALTHQRHSFVPVDRKMRPLRPAILWNDLRCREQVAWLDENIGRMPLYKRTGIPPGPWSLAKILWLKTEETAVWESTWKFLLVHDYLVYKLTGRLATTPSSASAMGCFDARHPDRWATDILELCGIPVHKLVSEVVPAGQVIGTVCKDAAAVTGLPPGLPVIAAAGDQVCGCLGSGVVRPGMVGINSGTSLTFQGLMPGPRFDENAHYILEISPLGYYAPETVVFSGVSDMMNWVRRLLYGPESEIPWVTLENTARSVSPGCDGLVIVPYLQGAQAPYWDENARGLVFGLRTVHEKSHFVRAVLEGLALESRRQLQLLETGSDIRLDEIRLYGGAVENALWRQLLATVTGLPVVTTATKETTALGAAICAAAGAGVFPSVFEAARAMVRTGEVTCAEAALVEFYKRLYDEVYAPIYGRVLQFGSRLESLLGGVKESG